MVFVYLLRLRRLFLSPAGDVPVQRKLPPINQKTITDKHHIPECTFKCRSYHFWATSLTLFLFYKSPLFIGENDHIMDVVLVPN